MEAPLNSLLAVLAGTLAITATLRLRERVVSHLAFILTDNLLICIHLRFHTPRKLAKYNNVNFINNNMSFRFTDMALFLV